MNSYVSFGKRCTLVTATRLEVIKKKPVLKTLRVLLVAIDNRRRNNRSRLVGINNEFPKSQNHCTRAQNRMHAIECLKLGVSLFCSRNSWLVPYQHQKKCSRHTLTQAAGRTTWRLFFSEHDTKCWTRVSRKFGYNGKWIKTTAARQARITTVVLKRTNKTKPHGYHLTQS